MQKNKWLLLNFIFLAAFCFILLTGTSIWKNNIPQIFATVSLAPVCKKKYRKYFLFLISSFAVLGLYGLFVLGNHFEKLLRENYQQALEKHIEIHQNGKADELFMPGGPTLPYLPGFNFNVVAENTKRHPVAVSTESGNVFIVYKNILHRRMPLKLLNTLNLISLALLSGLLFYFGRKHRPPLEQVMIFALLLYMLEEFFSPVERHQYNVV